MTDLAACRLTEATAKTPDCSGAFALEGTFVPRKECQYLLPLFGAAMLSGAGTCVVLIRWIRRAAFGGPAARARPCGHALGHALFIFRFLAGGSARTDGSLTGRAGRGLALSRRHERRAEEGRNDKSRDCKFGSHQEDLRRVTGSLQTSGRDLVPARDQHCANFIFKKNLRRSRRKHPSLFQTSVTFRT
jgi:hypothetical protein